MVKTLRAALMIAVAAGILVGAGASSAAAKTYAHGKTVWFSNSTIGEGDVVNGDLNVFFGDATCESGAVIRGNVHTYGGRFYPLDGCRVDGETIEWPAGSIVVLAPWIDSNAASLALVEENRRILTHLAYGVVILFAFLLFPMRVRVALERVEQHPGLSAAVGTLAVVAVIPVAVLLVLSIIGIPLVVVEVAALFAGLWIGQAAVAILVGRRLFELVRPHTTPSPLGALVLGLVVVSAAEILPVVGGIVTALVCLVGLGAAILAFVRETAFAGFVRAPSPPAGAPPPAPGTTPMRPA
jgi:hypothetical protein